VSKFLEKNPVQASEIHYLFISSKVFSEMSEMFHFVYENQAFSINNISDLSKK
jgi:hypothetical protein